MSGSSEGSKDNYEYYILGKDISIDNYGAIVYITDRASAYQYYGDEAQSLYINASIMQVYQDVNINIEDIIIRFNKYDYIQIYNNKQNIIKDGIDIYDYLALVFTNIGQSINREQAKQIFPLIQSSREEYYNIVDLDLPKNYEKILEERGYIE